MNSKTNAKDGKILRAKVQPNHLFLAKFGSISVNYVLTIIYIGFNVDNDEQEKFLLILSVLI